MLTIERATSVTLELLQAMLRLVPQLTNANPPPNPAELEDLINSGCSALLIARHSDFPDEIIGMATIALYRVPTGLRSVIEDVVVDGRARGRGIGEALTRAALEHARQAGAPQVSLTSNPGRGAANRLYQRLGFVQRNTNVYRYTFDK